MQGFRIDPDNNVMDSHCCYILHILEGFQMFVFPIINALKCPMYVKRILNPCRSIKLWILTDKVSLVDHANSSAPGAGCLN